MSSHTDHSTDWRTCTLHKRNLFSYSCY